MAPNSSSTGQQSPGSGFGLKDILYVVFGHKWKILFFSLLGLAGAAVMFVKQTPVYESQADLLVKYLFAHSNVDNWKLEEGAGGHSGNEITNAELAILRSRDLARSVVEKVGVEHFVGVEETEEAVATAEDDETEAKNATEPDSEDSEEEAPTSGRSTDPRVAVAASRFLKNLEVGSAGGSKVISIRYRHEDPQIVQRALRVFVDEYFEKHLKIYRPTRLDFVTLKDEESSLRLEMPGLRTSLRTLEEQLREASRGDTIKHLQVQRGTVQGGLLQAQADLAEQQMLVEMLTGTAKAKKEAGEEEADGVAAPDAIPAPSPQVVQKYQDLLALERLLREKKLILGGKFLPGAGALTAVERQLAGLQQEREALVGKHPGLLAAAVAQRVVAGGPLDLRTEATRLAGIKSRIDTFENQLGKLEERFLALAKLEAAIAAINLEIEEGSKALEGLQERLRVAELEQKINHRNMPNIEAFQEPSDPVRRVNKAALKLILGVAGSGIALGLAWAFLLEMVIDRRVKRPVEIESLTRMPLMLSIPKLTSGRKVHRLGYANGEDSEGESMPIVPADQRGSGRSEQILLYTEAIRDHLLYYFELNQMHHMPKLISFVGVSKGAGTSTLAAGVATSFAQAEAKVLLVDLHSDQQGCGGLIATNGSGERPTSLGINGDSGMTFNTAGLNLSLASFGGRPNGNGASTLAPRKFYELIPKFRGSEFDYVIFDMPAMGAISATSAMAGFMDKVVLVLDAENTDREDLKRGYAELLRGKADVSCVFNKARNNAPRWVEG